MNALIAARNVNIKRVALRQHGRTRDKNRSTFEVIDQLIHQAVDKYNETNTGK